MEKFRALSVTAFSRVRGRRQKKGSSFTFTQPHAQLIIVILYFIETTKIIGQEVSYLPPEILNPPAFASITVEEVSLGTTVILSSGFYSPPAPHPSTACSGLFSHLRYPLFPLSQVFAQVSALMKKSSLDPMSLSSHHPTSLCSFPGGCTPILSSFYSIGLLCSPIH